MAQHGYSCAEGAHSPRPVPQLHVEAETSIGRESAASQIRAEGKDMHWKAASSDMQRAAGIEMIHMGNEQEVVNNTFSDTCVPKSEIVLARNPPPHPPTPVKPHANIYL